jgi:hypothetical protein
MSFAARITFFTRRGAQSGTVALPWTIFAFPQLPLSVSPDPVVWVPPPDPVTEVPPPPATAEATGSAINAAVMVRPAASPIRVRAFPRLEPTCVGVCKITSLLRRPAGLAVGLALKEPAPPPRWVRPNRWFPRSPPVGQEGIRRLPVIDGAAPYTIGRPISSHKAHNFATKGETPANRPRLDRAAPSVQARREAVASRLGQRQSVQARRRRWRADLDVYFRYAKANVHADTLAAIGLAVSGHPTADLATLFRYAKQTGHARGGWLSLGARPTSLKWFRRSNPRRGAYYEPEVIPGSNAGVRCPIAPLTRQCCGSGCVGTVVPRAPPLGLASGEGREDALVASNSWSSMARRCF